MADNFDSPWKRALKREVADFPAFYFYPLWLQIDWGRPARFRDKELEDACRNGRPRGLVADLLASVFLRDGREILLHIEVQAQRDSAMALRIRELVDELLVERNVFAWVTAAHLLAQQTHSDPAARYAAKWRLVKLLYERGWRKRRTIDLFLVIQELMALPIELERRLRTNLKRLERRMKVEWLNPYDRLLIEKGEKKGVEIGRVQGRREGAAEVLERQLRHRFGVLPPTLEKRLAKASVEQLAQWSEAVLEARTLK